ncbi:hypothetical protein EJ06DRAFT_180869 [Trichodelitschia bisporula]|uniref:Acyltransferase 3 domain-containing protein n=1 Tax=Trichodelitschia bisporula TaxID=703511 RepID=A0A6G1HM85_9PEZI|nr:hypothetical protein EJ06DRAFT_180869 [Trichodelitschia bisporula]
MKDVSMKARDTKWVDGLRGVASVFVVTSHLTLAFGDFLLSPAPGPGLTPRWYNLPFIRTFAEGRAWVTVFLVLTGFVNGLKPIQQARSGRVNDALAGMASSCFRRASRLVLPTFVATVFAWLICQFGGFRLAAHVDYSWWLVDTSPVPAKTMGAAIHGLFSAIYTTWTTTIDPYDKNQWTMYWIFKGSITLYVVLLATVRAAPYYRMLVFFILLMYSWSFGDTLVGIPIYCGAMFTELWLTPSIVRFSASRQLLNRAIPISMVAVGLFIMSFPSQNVQFMHWSLSMNNLGLLLFPEGTETANVWYCVGANMITFGVLLSPDMQAFFSHPICLWLGKQSLPIYLLHGPLMRSQLMWYLYAFIPPQWVEQYDWGGNLMSAYPIYQYPALWRLYSGFIIYVVAVGLSCHWWTLNVEPWCARTTKWLEDTMCSTWDQKATSAPVLPVRSEVVAALPGDHRIMALPI